MKYIFHTTGNNERWDDIAYKYYGNCYNINPLIEANPHISIIGTLPVESVITVPISEDKEEKNSHLPIWKRV